MSAAVERQNRPRSLCVVGCGDLGLRLAGRLPAGWRVVGLRRHPDDLPAMARRLEMKDLEVKGLEVDYTRPGSLAVLEELAPDYLVATLKPAGRDGDGYRRGFVDAMQGLLGGLGAHRPRAVLMVSSTRVYAERAGHWVDEGGALAREAPAARAIVDAEQALLDSGHRAAVLRCAGIYGSPRGRLLSRIAAGEICAPRPLHYSNRIHRDDVAGFMWHLLRAVERGEELRTVYNVVDDCPAPQHEVEQWLAAALGVTVRAERPPPSGHKRCRNRALVESGYRLMYPDYRSGYEAVMAARAGGE
ncbi:epimerase [Parahaliea mediterranea]|uniref:Epimerase n=1 Tax=Parahaliea mediterranea TaxID=651086 RepID=A0A939DFN3_9GAMM|nr:epimerase [Parahaliea mediterranea]MBN7797245.1 epimerase [Parahaliea mediterranea]